MLAAMDEEKKDAGADTHAASVQDLLRVAQEDTAACAYATSSLTPMDETVLRTTSEWRLERDERVVQMGTDMARALIVVADRVVVLRKRLRDEVNATLGNDAEGWRRVLISDTADLTLMVDNVSRALVDEV